MIPENELRVFIVRHGQTEWNLQHRYLGHTDRPLNAVGKAQAQGVVQAFKNVPLDEIITSPLQRAAEIAHMVAEDHNLQPVVDERIREFSFGIFEGLTFEEARQQYPRQFAAWLDDYEQPPDQGEKLTSLYARTRLFLQDLQQAHFGKQVLVVSHGGPLRELIRQTLGLSIDRHWWFMVDLAAICEIRYFPNSAVIVRLNDTAHLHTPNLEK
ncbi:histidine phosphatase family protein [bacterium]|nr:histidine phosphatase family protein [bacterium]MCB2179075.1 histidine phosphatase family protein [bacterium]